MSITATYRGQDNIELEWVPPNANTGFDGFEIVVVRTSDGNQVSFAIFHFSMLNRYTLIVKFYIQAKRKFYMN